MSGNQAQQTRPVAIVTGASAGIGKAAWETRRHRRLSADWL